MRKNTLNYIVDALTLIAIVGMTGTGLIVRYTLPAGSGGRGLVLLGMDRHEWGGLHFWMAVGLGALLVLHVALHWAWVCGTTRRLLRRGAKGGQARSGWDNAYGVGFLVVLSGAIVGFVLLANASVEVSAAKAQEHEREHESPRSSSPGSGRHGAEEDGHGGGASHEESIRGSMTLIEAAQALGVSVNELLDRLGWPMDTPVDERIGRLSRERGMEMSEARELMTTAPEETEADGS
jgi:hypothetical protein